MSKPPFAWSDYNLSGPPALLLGDYTFKAYGLEEVLEKVKSLLRKNIENGLGVKWKLVGYWGVGKSTFVYNLCHEINKSFYFNDDLEKPEIHQHVHLLSFYVNVPCRRSDFLEYTFKEGLPIPWEPGNVEETIRNRQITLHECFRKLVFLLLRRILHSSHFVRDVKKINGRISKSLDLLNKMENLKTKDMIEQIDASFRKHAMHSDLVSVLRCHLAEKMEMSSELVDHLPNFLYPVHSSLFLESFRKLVIAPGYFLRNFDIVGEICSEANVHLFIAIDELEDWSTVVKCGLDRELLTMTENQCPSVALVFRTRFPKTVRRGEVFGRYLALWQRLDEIGVPEPQKEQIIEMTKGILLTSRLQMEKSLFPLTEDFVTMLALKTRRGGRFNIRLYIRTLAEILEKSLMWERNRIELTGNLLKSTWVRDTITDAIVQDIRKERELYDERTLLRSIAAAEIAEQILIKSLPDRTSLEELKKSISKKLNTQIPSNAEIIASIDDMYYRRRLQHIIESLTY